MPLAQTFTAAIEFLVSGINYRRTIFSGDVGVAVTTGLENNTLVVAPQTNVTLPAVGQMFSLVADNPITVVLTKNSIALTTDPTSLVIIQSSFDSITLKNLSSITINVQYAIVS